MIRRRKRFERLEDVIAYLREKREDRWWRDIIVSEIMSETIAEKVAEKLMEKLPRPGPVREISPVPRIREPHQKTVRHRDFLIRSDSRGYIDEFSFYASNKNFKLLVNKDGEYIIPEKTFDELDSMSEGIGWLTADDTPDGLYLVQIAGIEWDRKFEIVIIPTSGSVTLYNLTWRYFELPG